MIEIDLTPFIERHIFQVFVIGIVGKIGDMVTAHSFQNLLGDGGLTRTRPSGDTNCYGPFRGHVVFPSASWYKTQKTRIKRVLQEPLMGLEPITYRLRSDRYAKLSYSGDIDENHTRF